MFIVLPIVESYDDAGISTPTEYTMKATFKQGEAVLFGAYTDVTARDSWEDTGDLVELINNASDMMVQMPAKSTDPKDTAETITFTGDRNIDYNKTLTFPNGQYQYIKLVLKKDAVIEAKNMGQGPYNGFVRGWIKSGKKWVQKLDEPIYPNGGKNVHTFGKLQPNTTYQFKYAYYIRNGDSELVSKALTFKFKNVGSYPTEGVFNFYSDKNYGGLSPASRKVTFK